MNDTIYLTLLHFRMFMISHQLTMIIKVLDVSKQFTCRDNPWDSCQPCNFVINLNTFMSYANVIDWWQSGVVSNEGVKWGNWAIWKASNLYSFILSIVCNVAEPIQYVRNLILFSEPQFQIFNSLSNIPSSISQFILMKKSTDLIR